MKKVSTFAIFRIFDTKQFVQDTGVRSNTDVGWQGLVHSLTLIHPTGILSGWGQDSVKASQGLLHQTQLMDFALCTGVLSCQNRKAHPQTVPIKFRAWSSVHCSWANKQESKKVLSSNPPPYDCIENPVSCMLA